MAHSIPAQATRRSGLPRIYLAGWAGLAGISLAYLSLVAVKGIDAPGVLARGGPGSSATLGAQPLVTEAMRLRQNMKSFQLDVAVLRQEIEIKGQDTGTLARVAALEERLSLETGLPLAPRAPAPVAAVPAPTPVADASPPVAALPVAPAPVAAPAAVAAVVPPPPAAAPAPVAAVTPAKPIGFAPQDIDKLIQPLETGSLAPAGKQTSPLPKQQAAAEAPVPVASTPAVAAPAATPAAAPIAFGPAIVKAEPKPYGVQLSSSTTLDALRLSWSLLSEQHGAALRNLRPHYTTTGTEESGQTFDLMAGPVRSAADAKKICKALAARGTDCRVAEFAGEGL